jgi:hypothetical protein
MSKASSKASLEIFCHIGKKLKTEVVDPSDPSLERCKELVAALQEESDKNTMTVSILQRSNIGVVLGKTVKAIRRYKRDSKQADEWSTLMESCQRLISSWKDAAAKQESNGKDAAAKQESNGKDDEEEEDVGENALPASVSMYRSRLTKQNKEMYKDPPVLPPPTIMIESKSYPLPKRDKESGILTFQPGSNESLQKLIKDFHPNLTPEEVLRAGSFGGTYFRPITSAVTNVRYNAKDVLKDTVHPSWIKGLDQKTQLTSSTYRPQMNKFGVKCGGSLGMWESSGWIADCDPYGWFQWYCRFYQGRRCSDDARQVSRWLKSAGPKGRFRSQLCNKILAANTSHDDRSISPVIRQTMLHWGLDITPQVLEQHKKRVGKLDG